jgi:hypothetical protein
VPEAVVARRSLFGEVAFSDLALMVLLAKLLGGRGVTVKTRVIRSAAC